MSMSNSTKLWRYRLEFIVLLTTTIEVVIKSLGIENVGLSRLHFSLQYLMSTQWLLMQAYMRVRVEVAVSVCMMIRFYHNTR